MAVSLALRDLSVWPRQWSVFTVPTPRNATERLQHNAPDTRAAWLAGGDSGNISHPGHMWQAASSRRYEGPRCENKILISPSIRLTSCSRTPCPCAVQEKRFFLLWRFHSLKFTINVFLFAIFIFLANVNLYSFLPMILKYLCANGSIFLLSTSYIWSKYIVLATLKRR